MSISKNSGRHCGRIHREGFTLIEMTSVLAILALVFATATLSFRKPYQRAQFQSGVESLIDFDDRARRAAMAYGCGTAIQIDLDNQLLTSNRWDQGAEKIVQWTVPQDLRMEQVCLVGESFEKGNVSFRILANGSSSTYAVRVAGTGQQRWLVFLGGTGQCVELNNESELLQIMQHAATAGPDTH